MTLIIFLLVGIIAGFLVGLLPGISASFIMILFTPLLYGQDLFTILTFYLAVMSSSQYSSSIIALLMGVPGESTSLPAVNLRKHFQDNKSIRQAMYNCATGSFIGSMVSVIAAIPILYLFGSGAVYLKTIFLVVVGILSLVLCVISTSNKWYESLPMIAVGWILSKVGFEYSTGKSFLTFDNTYLMGGIPFIAVTVSLFVIPNLISAFKEADYSGKVKPIENCKIDLANRSDLIVPSMLSSVVGFITGLIPYAGNVMSSNVAYFVEKHRQKNNPLAQLTAAETANNAAWFSVMTPILLFGVAIVPSEMILLEILNANGQVINLQTVKSMLIGLVLIMVVINLINWILSFYSINLSVKLLSLPKQVILGFISVLLVYSVWVMGQEVTQGWYYIISTFILAPFGVMLYKKDTMPIVFAFLLQNSLEPAILRLQSIYL